MSGEVRPALIVEADGGSRGNPGPAGYGALVRNRETGAVLAERGESIGRATNNVAEYRGLIAGLEAVTDFEPSAVEVRMDSKLVVEQMSGRWKIKHADLQPLALRARRLAQQLPRVTYTWIPRAENSAADRLANQAMDGDPLDSAAPGRRLGTSGTSQLSRSEQREDAAINDDNDESAWTAAQSRELAVPTRLYLLRHGMTAHTERRLLSGRNEQPLTARGAAQAAGAAVRLAGLGTISAVISSPLLRSMQTAEAVADALHLSVEVDPDLVELDFGSFEGLSFAEAAQRHPAELRGFFASPGKAAPGGESLVAVQVRVERARRRILDAHVGKEVVVVSHVTPIKILLATALDVPLSTVHRMYLDSASLSVADWYPDGRASMRLMNDTPHDPEGNR